MQTYLIRGIFLFLFVQTGFAQEELTIDYKEIKAEIENENAASFYPKLLNRFNEFDTSLSLREYALIYYGFSFQEDYLKNQPDEKQLDILLEENDFESLVVECKKILNKNPVSLSANDKMGYALFKLGKPEKEWGNYQTRYRQIRNAIVYSGDGLTPVSAFKVIYVSDEYHIMCDYFDIPAIHSQSLVGLCDRFVVEKSDHYQAGAIYFDISRKLIRQEDLLNTNK